MTKKSYRRHCYETAHKQGKIAVWAVSTILLQLVIDDPTVVERIMWAAINLLYWFGVNSFAYISESLHNWRHRHSKF